MMGNIIWCDQLWLIKISDEEDKLGTLNMFEPWAGPLNPKFWKDINYCAIFEKHQWINPRYLLNGSTCIVKSSCTHVPCWHCYTLVYMSYKQQQFTIW